MLLQKALSAVSKQIAGGGAMLVVLTAVSLLAQGRLSEPIGVVKQSHADDNGVRLTTGNAVVQLSVYSPTMVRVRVARGDRFANDFSYAVIQSAQGKFTSMQDQGGQIAHRCRKRWAGAHESHP